MYYEGTKNKIGGMNVGVNARLLLEAPLEGMGRYTFETVYAMAKAHPDTTFYLFFDRKINQKYLLLPNMKGVLVWCPTRHPFLILAWLEILLPFYLKKHKIDVFYSADNFTSLLSSIPALLICHDLAFIHFPEGLSAFYRWFYATFMPLYLKRANKIGAVSAFVKKDIENFMGVKDKIFTAPNALPSVHFTEVEKSTPINPPKPYFIYVGSIHPRKNVKKMIEGFFWFNEKNGNKYNLVLLGRNAWGTAEIKHLLQNKYIMSIANAGDDAKMQYMAESEGLLYVSLNEGFGIPILEGFASRVPVITSDVSSMPEVAGEGAILVNPHSEYEIAQALQIISTDKVKCNELKERGTEKLKQYDWNQTGRIIYEQLKDLLH